MAHGCPLEIPLCPGSLLVGTGRGAAQAGYAVGVVRLRLGVHPLSCSSVVAIIAIVTAASLPSFLSYWQSAALSSSPGWPRS